MRPPGRWWSPNAGSLRSFSHVLRAQQTTGAVGVPKLPPPGATIGRVAQDATNVEPPSGPDDHAPMLLPPGAAIGHVAQDVEDARPPCGPRSSCVEVAAAGRSHPSRVAQDARSTRPPYGKWSRPILPQGSSALRPGPLHCIGVKRKRLGL